MQPNVSAFFTALFFGDGAGEPPGDGTGDAAFVAFFTDFASLVAFAAFFATINVRVFLTFRTRCLP